MSLAKNESDNLCPFLMLTADFFPSDVGGTNGVVCMSRDSSVTEVSHLSREQLVEALLSSCRRKCQLEAECLSLANRKLVQRTSESAIS